MDIWTITQAEYLNQNPGSNAWVHRDAVKAALAAGKAVSDSVLADYPDLRTSVSPVAVAAPPVVRKAKSYQEQLAEGAKQYQEMLNQGKSEYSSMLGTAKSEQDSLHSAAKRELDEGAAEYQASLNEGGSDQQSLLDEAASESAALAAEAQQELDEGEAQYNQEMTPGPELGSAVDDYHREMAAGAAEYERQFGSSGMESAEAAYNQEQAEAEDEFNRKMNPEYSGSSPSYAPEQVSEEEALSQIETPGELEQVVPQVNEPGTPEDEFTSDELLKLHLSRSRQAQAIDNRSRAKDTVFPGDQEGSRRWVRNPAKVDVEGIDTPQGM